jgi:excisionase family DNA binding protein
MDHLVLTRQEVPDRLLKARDVAEVLNISRAYAYQLMQRGELRTVVIGAARRVRPADLRQYIEGNLTPSAPQK